jgi:2'-hydroxyisoflavone reductase
LDVWTWVRWRSSRRNAAGGDAGETAIAWVLPSVNTPDTRPPPCFGAGMEILVLGGTQWVGRVVSREALERGHLVTCLARGVSGQVADGAELVTADRTRPDAYDAVKARRWDAVVEVSWQPGFVKAALAAISAGHWTYVSSGNVYLRHDEPGADESAELQPTTHLQTVTREQYGPAKRVCEDASRERYGDRLLVARAGLIGGPGDHTGRSGAWVARCARDPHGAVLIPSEPDMATQVVDVRDLAAFLVDGFEKHIVGTFNAVGPVVPFSEWFALARTAAQHDGQVVTAPSAWLVQQGVEEYMGPGSLAMWLADPAFSGWSRRSGAKATAEGMHHRPRAQMVADLLEYERAMNLTIRNAGLTPEHEAELLRLLLHPA